jgi:hypothetical protein
VAWKALSAGDREGLQVRDLVFVVDNGVVDDVGDTGARRASLRGDAAERGKKHAPFHAEIWDADQHVQEGRQLQTAEGGGRLDPGGVDEETDDTMMNVE